MKGRPPFWNIQRDQVLEQHYTSRGDAEKVAKMLGVKTKAVYDRARTIGIKIYRRDAA